MLCIGTSNATKYQHTLTFSVLLNKSLLGSRCVIVLTDELQITQYILVTSPDIITWMTKNLHRHTLVKVFNFNNHSLHKF